jgi:hypothetical protein
MTRGVKIESAENCSAPGAQTERNSRIGMAHCSSGKGEQAADDAKSEGLSRTTLMCDRCNSRRPMRVATELSMAIETLHITPCCCLTIFSFGMLMVELYRLEVGRFCFLTLDDFCCATYFNFFPHSQLVLARAAAECQCQSHTPHTPHTHTHRTKSRGGAGKGEIHAARSGRSCRSAQQQHRRWHRQRRRT